ncbi:MAG: hypothetical protein ACTSV7_10210 [Candidatus Baldrarchaeia archaeon]|nr:hypothetical protein [Candidatus Baldrarchaeota archaeon]
MSIKDFILKITHIILPAYLTYLLTFNKYSEINYKSLPIFLFLVLREVSFHSWKVLLAWLITGILVGGMLKDLQKHGSSISITIFTYVFLKLYLLTHYNIMSWNTLPLFQKIWDALSIIINFILNGAVSIIPTILIVLLSKKNNIQVLQQEFKPIRCPVCGRIYESNPKYCVVCGTQMGEEEKTNN